MNIQEFFQFMAGLEVSEFSGPFQFKLFNRVLSLVELRGVDLDQLTLGELRSCIEAARLEFNAEAAEYRRLLIGA